MATVAQLAERVLRRLGVVATDAVPPSQAVTIPFATIATTALVKLGVIASDETPLPSDLTLADAAVAAVHANQVAQGHADWTVNTITNAVSEEYASLAAIHLASAFGKTPDAQMAAVFEARIATVARTMKAQGNAEEAVMSVHDSLSARGLARWTVFDIPAAAEMPYELLAANRMARLFNQPADPGAETLATRQLAQIVQLDSSGERVRAEYF